MTRPGLTAAYAYDPSGLRVASTVNADKTLTIRGVGGEVLSEYRTQCGTTAWARDVVYVGGRLLGAIRATSTTPTIALVATTATVPEAQPSHSVGVRLTTSGAPTTCPVTVAYNTAPGSAAAGADFTTKTGILTFAAGTESGTVQFDLAMRAGRDVCCALSRHPSLLQEAVWRLARKSDARL